MKWIKLLIAHPIMLIPQFVTMYAQARKPPADGRLPNWDDPLGPEDVVFRIQFLSLFGFPIFRKITPLPPEQR